jgi:Major Facilitator Superfamily
VFALLVAADGPLAVAFALAAVFSILSTGHKPAQGALLPALYRTPQQCTAATAISSAIENGGFLVGALLGGTMSALTSPAAAFAAAGATFLAAAALQYGLTRDARPALGADSDRTPAGEAAAGLQALRASRQLRLVVGGFAAATVVEGATDVLVVLVALDLLDLGQTGVGYLNAAWGIGGVLGGAAAAAVLGRGRLALGLSAGCVLIGGCLAGLGVLASAVSALVFLGVLGVGCGAQREQGAADAEGGDEQRERPERAAGRRRARRAETRDALEPLGAPGPRPQRRSRHAAT